MLSSISLQNQKGSLNLVSKCTVRPDSNHQKPRTRTQDILQRYRGNSILRSLIYHLGPRRSHQRVLWVVVCCSAVFEGDGEVCKDDTSDLDLSGLGDDSVQTDSGYGAMGGRWGEGRGEARAKQTSY